MSFSGWHAFSKFCDHLAYNHRHAFPGDNRQWESAISPLLWHPHNTYAHGPRSCHDACRKLPCLLLHLCYICSRTCLPGAYCARMSGGVMLSQ